MKRSLLVGLLFVTSCVTQSPQQKFVNGCSTAGEAMVQVISLRRAGQIDAQTFARIDDLYDATVATCSTMPQTESALYAARLKIAEFLANATGVTGRTYGEY